MNRSIFSAILFASATAVTVLGGQKLAPELDNAEPGKNAQVIVTWRVIPEGAHHAKVTQRGGELRRAYAHMRAGAYSVPAQSLRDLANDPDVQYISPDRPLKGMLDLTAAAINAPTVWSQGYIGTGVTVAVIDSGLSSNPDLSDHQVVYSQDFTGEYKMSKDVTNLNNAPDTFGHGEHVTGIIAGNGKTSRCGSCTRSMVGIAPGVKIVNLRVLDENGDGSDSAVIAAIDQAIELKDTYGIRVINLSVGRPVFESYTLDPLCQAVEQAWQAGIVVVVAAGNNGRDNSNGNSGYGTITAPGNDPYVITVGAMKSMQTPGRTDDLIASYSSKGPTAIDYVVKPDLVAPGNLIVSLMSSKKAVLAQTYASNIPHTSYYMTVGHGNGDASKPSDVYFNLSGTSMATPVVTAAAADLLQAQPSLSPDQVKAILMMTSYKNFPTSSTATDPATGQTFVSYYDPLTVGAGYLDLAAALANTAIPQGSALSPSAAYDSTAGSIYFLYDPTSVWAPAGAQNAFSIGTVWPSSSITDQSASWGQRIAASSSSWGQDIMSNSASWGQRVVANSACWGQHIHVTSSTLSALSAGVPGTDPSIAAASTPTAQATPVSITGEQ